MATITTPTLAQIVAASKASGVSIADLILAIDESLSTPTIVEEPKPARKTAPKVTRASKPKQTTPKATKVDKKADVEAAPNMRETSDGRMMKSDPATATKGQIQRCTAFAQKHGFIVEDFAAMSMADASDWLFDAKTQI